jgi:glycosyltransferase involved in cell wall biosynthesis
MTNQPEISVVMGVYNGEAELSATMDSVLTQEGVDLEFIIVNDGSTDATRSMLDDYACRDERVRVFHQENKGLTASLIRGCAAANGEFIARQDVGDIYLRGKLAVQRAGFENNPQIVMTSCGTRFVGPRNELLYEVQQIGDELHRSLRSLDIRGIRGPSSHPSVMFRRKSYVEVGGYRSQFAVAQDLDLWTRLVEVGRCWAIPEIFCECRVSKNSISAAARADQVRLAKIILKCAALRRAGFDDSSYLTRRILSRKRNSLIRFPCRRRRQEAKFYYFIGATLRYRDPAAAHAYFLQAAKTWALFPSAWYRVATTFGHA